VRSLHRAEAALAVLVPVVMLAGVVLYYGFAVSPIHTDPAAIPVTPAGGDAGAHAAEGAAAERFARFMARQVFEPLGMERTAARS
jgi:hypothetical protein